MHNTGSSPMQAVTFSGTPPSGWDVTFDPKTITVLDPGASMNVVAKVRPKGDAVAGDYDLTLRTSGSGKDASVDVRYAVETSSWWGVVGVVVIALAVVVLLGVFRRYGRR